MLPNYKSIADGIAQLFFPYAEVAIHDFSTQRIIHIANNFSKRKLGDHSALEDFERDTDKAIIGPYEKVNWDGKKLRSISIVILDKKNKAQGLMCINMDISQFCALQQTLNFFLTGQQLIQQPPQLFKDDWQERINSFIHAWLQRHHLSLNSLKRDERKILLEALVNEGAFSGKRSADYVGRILNIGRATVYKHLKEIKMR